MLSCYNLITVKEIMQLAFKMVYMEYSVDILFLRFIILLLLLLIIIIIIIMDICKAPTLPVPQSAEQT